MLETHLPVAIHKEYTIYLRDPGFEFTPVMLAKIASYIAQHDDGRWTVFAFMYSLLEMIDNPPVDEESLLGVAVGVITEAIDGGGLDHRAERTFEYHCGEFNEVKAPRWWITTHQ